MSDKLAQMKVGSISHANAGESASEEITRNLQRSYDLKETKENHHIYEKGDNPILLSSSPKNGVWARVPRILEVMEDWKGEVNMSDLLDDYSIQERSYSYRNVHNYVIVNDNALVSPSIISIKSKSNHNPYVYNYPLSCDNQVPLGGPVVYASTDIDGSDDGPPHGGIPSRTVNETENDSMKPTAWNIRERSFCDVRTRERRCFSDTIARDRGLSDADVRTRERRGVSDAIARKKMCFSDATTVMSRRKVFTLRECRIPYMLSPLENCLLPILHDSSNIVASDMDTVADREGYEHGVKGGELHPGVELLDN